MGKSLLEITKTLCHAVTKHTIAKQEPHRFFATDSKTGKRIKAGFRCPDAYKKMFPGSHCLLPISVGTLSHRVRSPHEGAKFESTIELINRTGFERCTILVDDDIQLDTYAILYKEKNSHELRQIVLGVGDEWIKQHKPFYEKLEIPYEIKRWQAVEEDPDFPGAVKKIQAKYLMNEAYKKAFDENINEFLDRLEGRGVEFEREYGFLQCWNYLTKENAGMGFIWPKWGADFEIYPSGRNPSMTATYKYFIEPTTPNLLRPVALRFSKSNVVVDNSLFNKFDSALIMAR